VAYAGIQPAEPEWVDVTSLQFEDGTCAASELAAGAPLTDADRALRDVCGGLRAAVIARHRAFANSQYRMSLRVCERVPNDEDDIVTHCDRAPTETMDGVAVIS